MLMSDANQKNIEDNIARVENQLADKRNALVTAAPGDKERIKQEMEDLKKLIREFEAEMNDLPKAEQGVTISNNDNSSTTENYSMNTSKDGHINRLGNIISHGNNTSIIVKIEPPGKEIRENPISLPINQNGDQIYIERPPIEQDCYEAIEKDLALIRIKAPPGMGKTLLLNKVLNYTQKEKKYFVTKINFDKNILRKNDYTSFTQWFCYCLSDSLGFQEVHWDSHLGCDRNATKYIKFILGKINNKLIITMNDFEVLFEFSLIFQDFCYLVRSWIDDDDQVLKKLRIIIVHSTEPYVRYDINSSPFGNVGKTVKLLGFTNEQVKALANRLRLENLVKDHSSELKQLKELVNGHPYLITKALESIQNGNCIGDCIQNILKNAHAEEGIFGGHLRAKQNNLRQKPKLLEDYKKIVSNYHVSKTYTRLDSNSIFQLYGLGLVEYDRNENGCWPSCKLYQDYFYDILINSEG